MTKVKFNSDLIINKPSKLKNQFDQANELPVFDSQELAEEYYMGWKNSCLDTFCSFLNANDLFAPDYSPESLKKLEGLYYEYYEEQKFNQEIITIEDFEICMSVYFGNVMVNNIESLEWVAEKHFLTDNAYYLAIKNNSMSMRIGRSKDYYNTPNNKRKQSLLREFKKFKSIYG